MVGMTDDRSTSKELPELSVVIPAFNRADLILTALRSVLDQTVSTIEIIVVDDGSTDDTAHVVEALHDVRVRVIRNAHQGVSITRNTGARSARSMFITFLDSDDAVEPGWVDAMVGASRSGFDLFSCGSREIHPDGTEQLVRPASLGPAFAGLCARYAPGTFGIRREIFERAGGYLPGLRFGENTQLLLAIARLHSAKPLRVGSTEEALVLLHWRSRVYDAQLSYESGRAALDSVSDMLRRDPVLYANYLANTGVGASRLGRRADAIDLLKQAVKADPRRLQHAMRLGRAVFSRGSAQ